MTTVDARAVMRAVRDRDPSERIRLLQTIKPRLPEQYVPHVPHPTQQLFLLQNGREVLFGGGGGGGKALWVHIYIPTPTGWTTMGDIRAGDEVLGTDGRPCRVLAVSGVMYDHDCYEVTFSDGSMLIADAGHMWTVVDDAGEQSTITTREVRNHVKELSVPAVTARGVAYPPRRITSVTPRVSVPVQCITVDSHDHLFLAGRSMIPTHNSDALLMAALAYVDVPGYSALILRRTWPDLSLPGAIMDRAREWLQGTDAEPRDGGRVWRFPSGARLSFGYLQHDKDKFNYQCFTPDTEILTVDGWKPVADVQVGDPVATVSPESGAMHYFAVTKTYDYDFDGQMIDIFQKNGVSFTVTPNHTIFAGTEKVPTLKQYRADQLPYTATIPQTFDWKGVRPSTMLFPAGSRGTDLVFDGTTWVEFLGWYIAEGNCGSYNGRWEVKISQNKEQGRNQIESVLGRVAGLNAHWNDNGVSMNNRALVEYLKAHTETGDDGPPAYAKCLPEYVFRWDAEYAELLLKTLVAGDGTVYTHGTRSDGQMVFVSYSRRLADDVMRLAVHAGWRPTLLEHDGGDYKPGTTCYRVSLSKRTRQTALAGKQREVDYTGKVHCVTVEPYNNLVIRHRGRVSLSGNSAEFHYVAFDELTQFLESTYTYMFSRVRKPVVACARCRRPVAKYFADGIATVQWKHTESKTTRCDDPTPNLQSLREYGPAPDGTTLFDVPLRVRSASNPGGVGGAWVRDRFVNPATRVKGAVFIPSLLSDNPSLDQETYRHNLEHLSPVDRERLLNGDWDITEQGDYFQRHWFTFLDDIPRDTRIRWVRYWDLAATEKGDWTAGCLLGLTTEGQWIVADVRRMRGTPYEVERFIAATAATDGTGVAIRMEQEPGSSGVNTIDHYRRRVLVGYDFKPDKKTASKTVRANPVSSAAEAGNIILITGAWNREFLDEITVYPRGSHDDMCLAGDTGIHTPQGMVRLSEVRPGDTVLGRTGWTRVTAAGMTSPAATTVERFGVRATENHPVWTHRGWKPFTQVSNDDKLSICSVSGTDVTVQQCRADFVVGATSGTSMGIHHAHPDGSHVRWKDATTQGSTSRDTATSTTPAIKDMVTHCMSREPSRGPSGWSPWCSTGSLSGGTLIRLAPHIVGITNPAVSGSSKAYKPSTRRYGSSTTGLSRKGTISTTGMVITPTTTSAILNALTRHSIGPSTQSNDQRTQVGRNDWPISPVSDRWPLHGTVHQKDWRGTVNTPPTLGSVRSGTRVEPVYNITTEDHTYYANGVLVHNCDSLTGAFSMLARTKGRLLV